MERPYTLTDVDTRDPRAVARAVTDIAAEAYPRDANRERIEALFEEVSAMFRGHFTFFQRMDTVYHNLEHTLQATLCWARLFQNYQRQGGHTPIPAHFFHLGLTAALLHDIGYLKEEHDEHGTGAKFTFVHERRSCEMAQIYLARQDWDAFDIFSVQHMISCTGPRATIDSIPFRHRAEKLLGQMLCTADYLGQMSDPRYVEKLPILFLEFQESDTYRGIPLERRLFATAEDLLRHTPEFWTSEVIPKLEYDCAGLYRFLASPFPDGPNPYLQQAEANMARVRALTV